MGSVTFDVPRRLAVLFGAALTAMLAAGSVLASGPASGAEPATAVQSRPADPVAHDPTMAREGGYYYVIITGDAQQPNTYLPSSGPGTWCTCRRSVRSSPRCRRGSVRS